MVKERVQKKSYQQSLEDIKEKMKEKRTKLLANASAPIRRRARMVNKSNMGNNAHNILKSVQMNNASLAVALQAEKEKVRQANAVILQLKRDQQALFLHLLLLKRKLKEHEANASEVRAFCKSGQFPIKNNAFLFCASLPKCLLFTENQSPRWNLDSKMTEEITLPSTVTVRRRRAERTAQRRSERVKELLIEGQAGAVVGPPAAGPTTSDDRTSNQPEPGDADRADTEDFQPPTPEHVPARKNRQQRPARKENQQPRSRPERTGRNPERGCKPERASLKKPWENPKPRARSKSRDRDRVRPTRSKSAAPSQGSKANPSQAFNDTFDFDCEEAVHITPFKAKAEDSPSEMEPSTTRRGCSPSSPSSESDDSLYVPQKSSRTQGKSSAVTTRRGRASKAITPEEDVLPQPGKISGVHGVRTAGRGLSLCDVTNLSPAAVRKFCKRSRPADGRGSNPVPARKRRCTMAVDYTEPSLNAKLRRGDKFTDLQFLRSPVFKQKSKRRSLVSSPAAAESVVLFFFTRSNVPNLPVLRYFSIRPASLIL
uniref:Shugoshin C-terminal domain-containing protein n=1 Tax=Tetraodon nigroviridis TaxID=99883 RepID=H3C4Y9_TETNG